MAPNKIPDPPSDDDSDGFSEVSLSDSDSEPDFDLTDALSKPTSTTKFKGKGKATAQEPDDPDGDEAFIQASLAKANFKAGAQAVKSQAKKGANQKASVTGGGSFQSLGLHPALLRALLIRGFTTPTPIQRAALPHVLANPARDVVGMARTGSGKTLAYLVPLVQKLGGKHSVKFGARAVIMVPTRELALQVLKVGKDLAKGFVQGGGTRDEDAEEGGGKGEGLRWGMIVGGDSLEDQFSMVASNPDVIIATPGRLLHVAVEMNLELKSVQYIVFDEADRLFEMGFATQLHETLHRLPPTRQTLLFSATLPKSLVEFAKAGLQNPKLIRLDSETKISSDLQMAFLSVKPAEKEAALLVLLGDVIGVPKGDGTPVDWEDDEDAEGPNRWQDKKRKRVEAKKTDWNTKGKDKGWPAKSKSTSEVEPHQTIVFAATKHHVEYLSSLLTSAGYRTSHIYGSLDQAARRSQLSAFRAGRTNLLVVTDLAARGIDIPILENVINYDFPGGARAFVHRVGRTARAGRRGWAYSLVTQTELPSLMDLQLFLSRPVLPCPLSAAAAADPDYSSTLVLGTFPRDRLDAEAEYVRETLVSPDSALLSLVAVVKRAQKMYERSQGKASAESYRRAKELVNRGEGLAGTVQEDGAVHLIFKVADDGESKVEKGKGNEKPSTGPSRQDLLAAVNGFKPSETVFEIGTRGKTPAAQLMRDRRKSMGKTIQRNEETKELKRKEREAELEEEAEVEMGAGAVGATEAADEEDLEGVFEMPRKRKKATNFQDPEFYLQYEQPDAATERGYSLTDGAAFATQANAASFDLGVDDEANYNTAVVTRPSQVKWDRKTKKFVKGNQEGADNRKMIKTESGAKLPASFKSGAYDEWKSRERVRMPRVGEEEMKGRRMTDPSKYRHKSGPSGGGDEGEGDGDRDGPQKGGRAGGKGGGKGGGKPKVFGKTVDGKKKFLGPTHQVTRGGTGKQVKGKGKGRPGQIHRNGGIKTVDQMRKARDAKDARTARSNQPSKRKR